MLLQNYVNEYYRKCLVKYYEFLVQEGIIQVNIAKQLKKVKEQANSPRYIKQKDITVIERYLLSMRKTKL